MRLLHYSENNLSKIDSIPQINEAGFKPCGLWVSVQGEDDWESWCRSEEHALNRLNTCHEIILAGTANIVMLTSVLEIDDFHIKYSVSPYGDGLIKFINWKLVSEDYQGIIIAPYQWPRRLNGEAHSWYYGWDCASGCIWDAETIESSCLLEE